MGYTPDERIGKNIFKDPIIHPDDLKIKVNAFKQALSSTNVMVKAGFRLMHKDGNYRNIEAVYVNMLAEPRIAGIVANYHDVTEQRKLEQHREEFISIASHELRTPLTSVLGFAKIIKKRLEERIFTALDASDVKLKKTAEQVSENLNVKDLLDITRIRQGQLDLRESSFHIDTLINETVAEMQLGTKKHLILSDLNIGKKITADRERIGQVLNNLLSNAIKYSPDADKIIVTSKSIEENITVCVQDFGIGIRADVQKKIFDRFFRLHDKTHSYPGLGLGLYIASEIVKHHGGSLDVKSKPGKGSIFCFTIPLRYSPAAYEY